VSAEALEKADNLRQHSKDNQPLWLPSDGVFVAQRAKSG
jgi:hypothetical protein